MKSSSLFTSKPSGFRWRTSGPKRSLAPTAITLLCSFILSASAHAWNAVGHMTIGAIAEPRLNAHARAEVARLLPMVADTRSPDFMTAGVWMDDVRGDGVRLYDRWHYDNLGHSPDGTPIGARHSDNVAWAIAANQRILQTAQVSDTEKARALRFLIHTVEDAHNPLHCGSRFTKENPNGDSGGNRFQLEGGGANNLHSLWDGALGTFNRREGTRLEQEAGLRTLANELAVKYPEAGLPQSKILDPEKWIEEGGEFLKTTVYPTTATPDTAYLERNRPIAERQATLGGYRLANLLNTIWP